MGADLIDEEGRFSSDLKLVLELDQWSVILSNQSTPVSPGGRFESEAYGRPGKITNQHFFFLHQ